MSFDLNLRVSVPEATRSISRMLRFVMARLEGGGTETAWFNYSLSALRDEDGSVAAVLNITPETTTRVILERQLTEEQAALATSEERLRLAVDNADVGLWDVDLVNDRLIWPARTKAMFGISADVPVSMDDFYNGLHPDDREVTTAAFLAAADPAQRAVYDIEYRTIGKEDGVERWVAAKDAALSTRPGAVYGSLEQRSKSPHGRPRKFAVVRSSS